MVATASRRCLGVFCQRRDAVATLWFRQKPFQVFRVVGVKLPGSVYFETPVKSCPLSVVHNIQWVIVGVMATLYAAKKTFIDESQHVTALVDADTSHQRLEHVERERQGGNVRPCHSPIGVEVWGKGLAKVSLQIPEDALDDDEGGREGLALIAIFMTLFLCVRFFFRFLFTISFHWWIYFIHLFQPTKKFLVKLRSRITQLEA